MLVKFNKLKAMETLPEMILGKNYEVTVSGKLTDGKPFKGTTTITITEWKAKHGCTWDHLGWLNSDKDIDQWWNKERETSRIDGLVKKSFFSFFCHSGMTIGRLFTSLSILPYRTCLAPGV
jgi:hypothetical protein